MEKEKHAIRSNVIPATVVVALEREQSVGGTSDGQRFAVVDSRPFSANDRRIRASPYQISPPGADMGVSTMNLHWTEAASCVSVDSDLFFPLGDEAVHAEQIAAIRRICATCPAARRCLEWALATGEPEGIWAGTTPGERRRIRAARRSGHRPSEPAVTATGGAAEHG
jgi:WhiB family transcriptional regulator, redox-sensing transcriptional regulator